MSSHPQLISFALCPFVQRSVITLRKKQVEVDVAYIDLANKPQWFLDISPTGKVPLLRVGDEVLFESAVINEYLDETEGQPLHPTDPLTRAKHRGWIEVGSAVLGLQWGLATASDLDSWAGKRDAIRGKLEAVEGQLDQGPWFSGSDYSLVDAAWAPFFLRQNLLDGVRASGLLDGLPKVSAWAAALVADPDTHDSVSPSFDQDFLGYMRTRGAAYAA